MITLSQGRRRGVVLPLLIVATVIAFEAGLLLMNLAAARHAAARLAVAADAALLSSLRLRATALSSIAARWEEIGAAFGSVLDTGAVDIAEADRAIAAKALVGLKQSVSGYSGRVRAVATVVVEANGVPRAAIDDDSFTGADLGLSAEPLRLESDRGQTTVPGGWYRREWPGTALDPSEDTLRRIVLHRDLTPVGSPAGPALWRLAAVSTGRLVWDAAAVVRSAADANGGFPRSWPEAVSSGRRPHRTPYYRALLSTDEATQ